MSTLKFKFASAILNARTKRGYTQQQVAEATSISVRWYQRIEHGERLPNTMIFLRIAIFLDIDIKEFQDVIGLSETFICKDKKE